MLSKFRIFVIKEIKLYKIGKIDESLFSYAQLYENDNRIAEAKIYKGQFYFRGFTSVLQPDNEKKYSIEKIEKGY